MGTCLVNSLAISASPWKCKCVTRGSPSSHNLAARCPLVSSTSAIARPSDALASVRVLVVSPLTALLHHEPPSGDPERLESWLGGFRGGGFSDNWFAQIVG